MNWYNFAGVTMFIWYSSIRWTMFKDHVIYWWAYEPINMLTAFSSVLFLTFAFPDIIKFFTKNIRLVFFGLAFYLCYRNCYYTVEDILDISIDPLQQIGFIIIDLLMAFYTFTYMIRNRNDLADGG